MTDEQLFEERIRIVLQEVRMMRLEPTLEAVATFVANAFSLPEGEQKRIIDHAMEIVGTAPRPKEKKVTEPKNVLRGKKLVAAAAHVFRDHPDYTARQAYVELLEAGHKIAMSESSFVNGTATAARKLASGKGELPKAPAPPAREPIRGRPREDSAASPRPNGTGIVVHGSEGNDASRFKDGNRILVELGDQKLDARREDGRWDVDFSGTVGDELVAGLLGRAIGGAAG